MVNISFKCEIHYSHSPSTDLGKVYYSIEMFLNEVLQTFEGKNVG